MSQPSLSQAVRALERDLGSELFHRIGRRAVLTEAGRVLIDPAREAVRSLQTARASVAAVHELREGRLDVASTPSQAVEPLTTLVSAFSHRYPGVSVANKAAFTSRDVIDMVRTGAVELGLLASAGPVSGKEVVPHELGRQRFVLVVPGDGPFPDRTAVDCRELAGQRLIVGQRGTGMRAYVDGLREQGVEFIVAAFASVLANTDVRTRDLGGTATTAEFTDRLIELLRAFRKVCRRKPEALGTRRP